MQPSTPGCNNAIGGWKICCSRVEGFCDCINSQIVVNIGKPLHFKSKNVIYLITCNKCNVHYVGSTTNEFKVRFRNHNSAMSTKKNTFEVAIHLNKETHVLSDFDFIIEQIWNFNDHNSLDDRLLGEAFRSAQLCTLQPHGLNKELGIELDKINTSKFFFYHPQVCSFLSRYIFFG